MFLLNKAAFAQQDLRFHYEVNEVRELMLIAMAISSPPFDDSSFIRKDTPYFEEVVDFFGNDNKLPLPYLFSKQKTWKNYHGYLMDAVMYAFSGDTIVKIAASKNLSWGEKDHIAELVPLINFFAKKTKFRQFYQKHLPYYKSLVDLLQKQAPLMPQWTWMEKKSKVHFNQCYVFTSPLINGRHATHQLDFQGKPSLFIYIGPPITETTLSKPMIEAQCSRMLFTELDHNYVNPVGDQYEKQIKQLIKRKKKWARSGTGYASDMAIFNEYMTWAVYLLYASERYDDETFHQTEKSIIHQMQTQRGFHKFDSFYSNIKMVYTSEMTLEELYTRYFQHTLSK